MSQLLSQLAEAPGAPGSESAVRALFQQHLTDCGEITHDKLGNIFCTRAAPGPHVMLTAHMDEVAFAVQSITKRGFLKIVPLGGWWTHNLLAQRVRVFTRSGRNILGVIASTPPHFLAEAQREKVLPMDQLFIDVGAANQAEAEQDFGIALGDPIVPVSEYTPMANPDLVMCKAFDNRVGCGVMIETMLRLREKNLPCSVTAVGTVQEELGCRGAAAAATQLRPDVALILEGTPADDTPGMDATEAQGALNAGPQLRLMDPTALMNRPLVDLVHQVARDHDLPCQLAVRRTGGTDAQAIHRVSPGIPSIVIGVPARYIHSHNSLLHLRDYEHTLRLMEELLQRLDAPTVAALTDWQG